MSSSSSEAQIKSEIERLTATISQHKFSQRPTYAGRTHNVNPTYISANKYIRPGLEPSLPSIPSRPVRRATLPAAPQPTASTSTQVREVVLNGVAFETSTHTLVRKDVPKSSSIGLNKMAMAKSQPSQNQQTSYLRKSGHLIPPTRTYKPRSRRGGRNMTLDNTRRPYQSRRMAAKKAKYSDKPCPQFTTTGSCSRGLTCMYQHDPSKIAICWSFLQGNCASTATTCALSHDPTPERTPLCLHFLNRGRCTREGCPFPHVNVGARAGVCRDFAVLGYCERGLDCDKQHVRECPDFAEKGTCGTKGCKLPHVIRANRTRVVAGGEDATTVASDEEIIKAVTPGQVGDGDEGNDGAQALNAESGQLGDEYISLTFHEESGSDDQEEEGDDEEDDEGEDANDERSDNEGMEA